MTTTARHKPIATETRPMMLGILSAVPRQTRQRRIEHPTVRKAVQLPSGLYEDLAERAKSLRGGRRGLVRHVWTLAALIVMEFEDPFLKRAAREVQHGLDDGQSFEELRQTMRLMITAYYRQRPKPTQDRVTVQRRR